MAGVGNTGSNLSALIQIQGDTKNLGALRSLKALQSTSSGDTPSTANTEATATAENKKALKTAREFESLLIHSMLKSMRKTTLAENTSNQRALYDDMLDKQLAETMVKGGGLGVAEQLMAQLKANNPVTELPAETTQDQLRLRALVSDIHAPANTQSVENSSVKKSHDNVTSDSKLREYMANNDDRRSLQQRFTEPLEAYARRSAEKLGTTPNAILAIAALETGWGNHVLKNEKGESTNNYFGIKAVGNNEEYSENLTREFLDGDWQKVKARFRTYDSAEDSINGFTSFILNNPRYAKAVEHAEDPERFLKEIHKAGYATDPQYAEKAISILNQINKWTARL